MWVRRGDPSAWRYNPGTGEIDITIVKRQSRNVFRADVRRNDPDPVVPSRTIQQHEDSHALVADRFWQKENLDQVLAQVGISLDARNLSPKQRIAKKTAIMSYLRQYSRYAHDRIVDYQQIKSNREPGGRVGLVRPVYVDPMTSEQRGPSQADLEATMNELAAGVPGYDQFAVEGDL